MQEEVIPRRPILLVAKLAVARDRRVGVDGAIPQFGPMRLTLCGVPVWLGLVICACGDPPPQRLDSIYRSALLARRAQDQAIRDSFTAEVRAAGQPSTSTVQRLRAIDSANTAWLKPRIRESGWPSTAQVGRDGVAAAFLLVQHADNDPDFQEQVLPMVEAGFREGTVTGENLALLTDRVLKAHGQMQRYGTQMTMRSGQIVIDPIEDPSRVDARRNALGLPSLQEYKRLLDSVYAPRRRR